jgi:menaquinone-dependent protoporphyrinogen oxidase
MKTLIAFASRYGQTQKIAAALQQQLVDVGIDCRLTTCRELLGRHDFLTESSAVILGSPTYYGAMDRDLERLVSRYRDQLNVVPSALFTVCFGVSSTQETDQAASRDASARFLQRTGWNPQLMRVFAGALRYSKYGWFKKRLVHWMAKRSGLVTPMDQDLELTDWTQAQAFGNQFIHGLMGKPIADEGLKSASKGG